MPRSDRTSLIRTFIRRVRRNKEEMVINKLLAGFVLDDMSGNLDLDGGFQITFPLVDEENPDRDLIIRFRKTGDLTFTVTSWDADDEWIIGPCTLRSDIPLNRAAADMVLTFFPIGFLLNANMNA